MTSRIPDRHHDNEAELHDGHGQAAPHQRGLSLVSARCATTLKTSRR
ncbi:hypothetical protein [Reticulibacter mediterranei]|nr:hypothetical protein [Reticulibacter mediterranei]